MTIFNFDDYRSYLKAYIQNLPKSGRGFAKKLASDLGVSAVLVSQVLAGDREFNQEQALKIGPILGLNSMELDYLLLLVQRERSGTFDLKQYHQKKIDQLKLQSQEIKNRVLKKMELSDETKAIYYSHWYYAGIRLLICNEEINTPEQIAEKFHLSLETIRGVLDFLEHHGLIETTENKIYWRSSSLHLPRESPLANRNHQNWRIEALKKMESPSLNADLDLFFTSPMVVDLDCAKRLKNNLLKFIEENQKEIKEAKSENVFCLNIDFFPF